MAGMLKRLKNKSKRTIGTGDLSVDYGIRGAKAVNKVLRGTASKAEANEAAGFMAENPGMTSRNAKRLTAKYKNKSKK